MAVREDISEIKEALERIEANPSKRNLRALHNLLASNLVTYGPVLGLSDDDVVAFGGGTNKPDEG